VDDACVHAKVGLREVFNFRDSSLTRELRNYCFTAHFDFLVTDAHFSPLFAVEFDGPTHRSPEQRLRDAKKNACCKIFGLSLLRINSRYLNPSYRGTDLLAWFTESFFVKRAFDEAQVNGLVSPEEGFMPHLIYSIGDDRRWPLWLSHDVRRQLRVLHKSGKCHDWIPSYVVGRDQEQTCRAIAVIAVTDKTGVIASTAMKAQQFPIAEEDAIEELVVFEVFESLQRVLSARGSRSPFRKFISRYVNLIRKFVSLVFHQSAEEYLLFETTVGLVRYSERNLSVVLGLLLFPLDEALLTLMVSFSYFASDLSATAKAFSFGALTFKLPFQFSTGENTLD
jgi:hypothetical protein